MLELASIVSPHKGGVPGRLHAGQQPEKPPSKSPPKLPPLPLLLPSGTCTIKTAPALNQVLSHDYSIAASDQLWA